MTIRFQRMSAGQTRIGVFTERGGAMIAPCPFQTTPIVADMRETARDLGVVSTLLECNKILRQDRDVQTSIMLLDRVLMLLGVTNDELLEHLKGSL